MNQIKTTLKLFAILTVLVGIIYPVVVTHWRSFFPKEAGEAFYMILAASRIKKAVWDFAEAPQINLL